MGWLMVNTLNQAVDVEDINFNKIGKINVGEAYGSFGQHTSPQYLKIRFRNSSGSIQTGYLFADWGGAAGDVDTPWTNFHVGTVTLKDYSTLNNVTHKIYNVRRTTNIYKPDGTTIIDTISAGGQVAMMSSYAGESGTSNPDWMLIHYYKKTSSSAWQSILGSVSEFNLYHGFVPIGLNHGSTKNTLSVYGNW